MLSIRCEYGFFRGRANASVETEWLMNFWKARNAANGLDGSFKCECGEDEKEIRRRVRPPFDQINTWKLKVEIKIEIKIPSLSEFLIWERGWYSIMEFVKTRDNRENLIVQFTRHERVIVRKSGYSKCRKMSERRRWMKWNFFNLAFC